jgi:type IV pilus assembly protein PilE
MFQLDVLIWLECATAFRRVRAQGFTMIELMMTLAVVSILAAVAVPSYKSYIAKSRVHGAKGDVMGMSLAMERAYQKKLAYPAYGTCGVSDQAVAALPASRTPATLKDEFSGWLPTQSDAFQYSVQSDTRTASLCGNLYGYAVLATANNGFGLDGCVLTLQGTGERTATAACGFTAW